MNLTAPSSAFATPQRQRERDILASVRGIFAEKGFDGASMQDIARATGMSAGNFYRYFPSKAALIEALIAAHMSEVDAQFAVVVAAPQPMVALRAALRARIASEGLACDDAPIWAEINAAALRKPEIAALVDRVEHDVARYLTQAMALSLGIDPDKSAAQFEAQARLLVLLVKGHAMQQRTHGSVMPSLTALVQRMVDGILDEIEATVLPHGHTSGAGGPAVPTSDRPLEKTEVQA